MTHKESIIIHAQTVTYPNRSHREGDNDNDGKAGLGSRLSGFKAGLYIPHTRWEKMIQIDVFRVKDMAVLLPTHHQALHNQPSVHSPQDFCSKHWFPDIFSEFWGVAKGSSVSWVAKFKGDKSSECKLSNEWSRSYKEIKLLLSAGEWVVAKLQGDKSASQSSMELYYWWAPRLLRSGGVLVEVFFLKTVVRQLYCA